jgi:hypothetical protein
MGTRNLTCVIVNGDYKIAKYGQWDGYPSGLGISILNFLQTKFNKNKFKKHLNKVKFVSSEQIEALWVECGADDNSCLVNMQVSDNFNKKYPYLSRDCSGAKLLDLIQDGHVDKQKNSFDFAADSLFCEWCYVIDLDKNTFEVYQGFNKTKLDKSERFFSLQTKDNMEYYPVSHLKTFSLDNLPTPETFVEETE